MFQLFAPLETPTTNSGPPNTTMSCVETGCGGGPLSTLRGDLASEIACDDLC